jgi:UbiD family decarboxylase
MHSLSDVLEDFNHKGYIIKLNRKLDIAYEPTRELIRADKEGKTVVFEVKDSCIICVGEVLNTRAKLYSLLRARNDEEAYKKVLSAMNNYTGKLIEKEFTEFYIKYEGDLNSLPAIKFFEKDGGRYITSSIVVVRSQEDRALNASVHRLMLVEDKGFAIRIVPRHLYKIVNEDRRKGRETPVAIAVGAHPLVLFSASISPPYGVFEFNIYEPLHGYPLPIVYTPKYGLPVPAYASVVLEGKITLSDVEEGPFVDLLQLYDRVRKQPLIKIEDIYTSILNIPFHVILPGGLEHKIIMGFPKEAAIWEGVRRVVPKVNKVRLTDAGGNWLHAIISIDKNNDGDAKSAILAAFASHPSLKHVIVVDSDIDPDNLSEVEWAIATRFQAGKGLIVIRHARGSTLDPSAEDGITDKVGIDATVPINDRAKYEKPRIP